MTALADLATSESVAYEVWPMYYGRYLGLTMLWPVRTRVNVW